MSGLLPLLVLFISLVFVTCGAVSVFAPAAARRSYRRLRPVSEGAVQMPLTRRSLMAERLRGGIFLLLGACGLLLWLGIAGARSLGKAPEKQAADFRSAVRSVITAEGPRSIPPPPKPPEPGLVTGRVVSGAIFFDVDLDCWVLEDVQVVPIV